MPIAVHVPSDDQRRDTSGACLFQRRGGALCVGARRPSVVDKQHVLVRQGSRRDESPHVEGSLVNGVLGAFKEAPVTLLCRLDNLRDDPAEGMLLVPLAFAGWNGGNEPERGCPSGARDARRIVGT